MIESPGYLGITLGYTVTYSKDGTTEHLSLVNEDLGGRLFVVDTAQDLYGVVGADGVSALTSVGYTSDLYSLAADRYLVDGVEVDLAGWELALDDLDIFGLDRGAGLTASAGLTATEHRLVSGLP